MKRGGPLKRSNKPMAQGGLPAPTKAQEALFRKLSDQIGCVVCLFYCRHEDGSRVEGSIAQIHHLLSGGNRISHWHVIPLCKMHHDEGKPGNPSFHSIMGKYGKSEFEETFATEMELVIKCEEWINQPYVTGLLTDEQAPQNAESCDSSSSDTDAECEPDNRDVEEKPVCIREMQKISWRVHISVTHHLYRPPDMDNLNAKGAIDGLVTAGLLKDDTAEHVAGVTHYLEKIKKPEQEKTVITLSEVI